MKLRWLCFADVHFCFKNFSTSQLRINLIKYLNSLDLNVDFIIIAGDLAYKGINDEGLWKFLENILTTCKCTTDNLFITPGNHDIVRTDDRTELVNKCIKESKDNKNMSISGNRFSYLTADFTPFKECDNLLNRDTIIDYSNLTERDSYRILNINSNILSCGSSDKENLFVCSEKLADDCSKINKDEKLNIAFMHHGVDWLNEIERGRLQTLLEDSYIDIIFSGHSHKMGIETYDYTCKQLKQLTCGGIISDNYSEPSFFDCTFDSNNNAIKCVLHKYSSSTWHIAEHSLRPFEKGIYYVPVERLCSNITALDTYCADEDIITESLVASSNYINFITNVSLNYTDKIHNFTALTYEPLNYQEENYTFEKYKLKFSKEYQIDDIICISNRIIRKFNEHTLFNCISTLSFEKNSLDIQMILIWLQLLSYLITINRGEDVNSWDNNSIKNLKCLSGIDAELISMSYLEELIYIHNADIYLYFVMKNYNELLNVTSNFIFDNINIEEEKIVDLKMTNDKILDLSKSFIGQYETLKVIKEKLVNLKNDYILLYGDEGYGKTALISKLVSEINTEYFSFNIGKNIYEFTWLPRIIIIDGKRVSNNRQAINLLFIQSKFLLNKDMHYKEGISNEANVYLLFEQLKKELGKCIIIFDAIDEFNNTIDFLPDTLPLGINVLITSRKTIKSSILKNENILKLRGLNKDEIKTILDLKVTVENERFLDKVLKKTNGCPLFICEIKKELSKDKLKIQDVQIINSLERLFQKKRDVWISNILLERILEILIIYEPVSNLSLNDIQGYLRYITENKSINSSAIELEIEKVIDQIELGDQKNYKIRYKAFFEYMIKNGYTNWDLKDIYGRIINWFKEDLTVPPSLLSRMYIYWRTIKKTYSVFDLDIIIDVLINRESSSHIAHIVQVLINENDKNYNMIIEKILNYLLEKDENRGMGYSYNYLLNKKDECSNQKAFRYIAELSLKDNQAKLIYAKILLGGNKYVEKNFSEGMEMLKELSEAEYALASLTLAIELIDEKPNESQKYALKAANSGEVEAMFFLALQLCSGEKYKVDFEEAVNWLEKSIQLKYTKAMYYYAIEKIQGGKLEKDIIGAENLLRKGYELGDSNCAYLLGRCYLEKIIISSNESIEGEVILRKLTEKSNVKAMIYLGKQLLRGQLLDRNIKEGYDLLIKAADLSCEDDKYYISIILLKYCNDNSIATNHAMEYLYKLADNGNEHAQYELAYDFMLGKYIQKCIEKGSNYLNISIESGNSDALLFKGILMIFGYSILCNLKDGYNLIIESAIKGNDVANNIINKIKEEKIEINDSFLYRIKSIICIYDARTVLLLNENMKEENLLKSAEIHELIIDSGRLKKSKSMFNDFAYLIRKEKYKPHNPKYTIEFLLADLVAEKYSLSMVNYALYKLELDNSINWNEALKLIECIDIDEESFEDVILWWDQLLKNGDLEGGLVLLCLSYFEKYVFDSKVDIIELIEKVRINYVVPDCIIEKFL